MEWCVFFLGISRQDSFSSIVNLVFCLSCKFPEYAIPCTNVCLCVFAIFHKCKKSIWGNSQMFRVSGVIELNLFPGWLVRCGVGIRILVSSLGWVLSSLSDNNHQFTIKYLSARRYRMSARLKLFFVLSSIKNRKRYNVSNTFYKKSMYFSC